MSVFCTIVVSCWSLPSPLLSPADRSQVEGRGFPLHQGPLPATAAAVRRPPRDAGVGAGPALAPRPPPPQQGLLRQRRLG